MVPRGSPSQAVDDAAWALAMRLGRFGYADISAGMCLSMERATRIVRGWQERRLVEREGGAAPGRARALYAIAPEAAQRWAAQRAQAPTAAGNMWFAARQLRSFTPVDLAAWASAGGVEIDAQEARGYCQMLLRAGYLRAERKARPGKAEAIYRMVRDTGPKPPRERRVRAVWDDNLGQFTHIPGGAAE